MSEGHWQIGVPTEDGFYWMRQNDFPEFQVCEVIHGGEYVRTMDGFPEQHRSRFTNEMFWSERIENP